MKTYEIASDSHSAKITASNADEAASQFDDQVKTMAALIDKVETLGGYISVAEDGIQIERVSS